MKIVIYYLLENESEVATVYLDPAEYCDPLEDGETFEDDGIERFSYAYEYLDIPVAEIRWTVLYIRRASSWRRIRTQMLAGDSAMLSHREDSDGYQELLHTVQLSATDCHITRIFRRPEIGWCACYDAIITDLPDGSQAEKRFDATWNSSARERFAAYQSGDANYTEDSQGPQRQGSCLLHLSHCPPPGGGVSRVGRRG